MSGMEIRSLRFENLSFSHGEDAPILKDVSFSFPMESNVWISGSSGAGKSTVVKIMAALAEPQAGSYFVNEMDVAASSFEEFLPYRIRLGYSTDYGGLLSNKTLAENILLPVIYHRGGRPELVQWVHQLMEIFELISHKDIRPASVTGAIRKTAVVARAFSLKPEAIFLDNPTEGMDRKRREELAWVILQGRKDGWLKHVFVSGNDSRLAHMLGCVEISVFQGGLDLLANRKVAG